jgi:opacity protein-like surface antigen
MCNRWLGLAGLVALLLCTGAPAQAQWWQHKFEVDPFVGYETPGSFPVVDNTFQVATGDRLRADGTLSYGTFIDYSLTRNAQVEFSWHRTSPTFNERVFPSTVYAKAFDSDIDQYQFGLLYMLFGDEHKIRPYIAGGLGFAHQSNSGANPSSTKFAYNLGGGVKYMFTSHFGLRGDARFVPIRENSSIQTICDPFGFCFNAKVGNYLNRGNFTAGLVFQF